MTSFLALADVVVPMTAFLALVGVVVSIVDLRSTIGTTTPTNASAAGASSQATSYIHHFAVFHKL